MLKYWRMRWYERVLNLFATASTILMVWFWLDDFGNMHRLGLAIVAVLAASGIRMVIMHDVDKRVEEADE